MRNTVIIFAAAAALSVIAGVAFEANATIGAGTEGLPAEAKSYSQVEKTNCNDQGLFCRKGSALQCNPICICVPCSQPVRPHKHKR
jgi:hypothetical protein